MRELITMLGRMRDIAGGLERAGPFDARAVLAELVDLQLRFNLQVICQLQEQQQRKGGNDGG